VAIFFGGILLLVLLAVVIGLNVSARNLEKRLSALVQDQLDRVRYVEHALSHLKGESTLAPRPQTPTV
jgi:hypothetical protein